jgi:uncharacterized protein YcbX
MARIQAIYRYPVKGLSAEQFPRTALTTGETVPGDWLYAIENGPCGFDPAMPSYLAKQLSCAPSSITQAIRSAWRARGAKSRASTQRSCRCMRRRWPSADAQVGARRDVVAG